MYKWFVIAFVAVAFAFGAPLVAQGKGGGKGNWGKGGYKGPAGQPGQGGGQGGDDWRKKAEDEIGWGEDGTEERVLPGDTVKSDDKEKRLEEEADKLGLEDKKLRKEFIKYGKQGWEKAEKEDARWAKEHKKLKSDEKALEKGKTEHKEKLDKGWAEADESQLKKGVLDEEQLEKFKKNTEDLRKETATDKSARQDEIRARKVAEWKEQAGKWAKGGQGGGDNEVKKEKKEEEGAEKEKKEEE
jgi:hypothetical protein